MIWMNDWWFDSYSRPQTDQRECCCDGVSMGTQSHDVHVDKWLWYTASWNVSIVGMQNRKRMIMETA